jgi:hypothetical protein
LIDGRLDLLQTDNVRTFTLEPVLKLDLPRAYPVYVPGSDSHGSGSRPAPWLRLDTAEVIAYARICKSVHSGIVRGGIAATAWAQRTPAAESGGIGGDFGVFLPAEDQLSPGLAVEGFYEYYLTARTSVRTGLGWANPNFDREEEDSLRQFRVALDVAYNWEGGTVHPFVGAGVGIYFLQLKDNGESFGDSESKSKKYF